MMVQFKVPPSSYSIVLILTSALIATFLSFFFLAYFSADFVTEYRTAAPLITVLGFLKGINPYREEYVDSYGNVYSALWPGIVYLLAKLFSLESYDQIKLLMHALNAI